VTEGEREGDNVLMGYTGLILVTGELGDSASVNLAGTKGLIEGGTTCNVSKPEHLSIVGLLMDRLTRCDIVHLAVNAAGSASTFVAAAAKPRAMWALLMSCSAWHSHRRRVSSGMTPQILLLLTCKGALHGASRWGITATPIDADHLYIWRGGRSQVVSNFLTSCVEGRADGPSPQRSLRRWNWVGAASRGYASGPNPHHLHAWRWGCHRLRRESGRTTLPLQPSEMAFRLPLVFKQFEGAHRLGRRTSRPRGAAATLPLAKVANRCGQHGPALRPPPLTPPLTLPGIPTAPVPPLRAVRVAS
jgi:hypothetical protein